MNVINNGDDLIRLLEENQEFRDAVRSHLLTPELLALPERFAAFETEVRGFMAETREDITELKAGQARLEADVNTLKTGQARLETAVGELRGKAACQVINDRIPEVATAFNLNYRSFMIRSEKVQILHNLTLEGVTQDERRRFYGSDLLLTVTGGEGQKQHIALEASYTADARDTDRALRNAEIMTAVTGEKTLAAVASVNNDRHVKELVDSGAVLWYRLEPEDFTPD